jgi:hypothetical protein
VPTALTCARCGHHLHAHFVKVITFQRLIEGQG